MTYAIGWTNLKIIMATEINQTKKKYMPVVMKILVNAVEFAMIKKQIYGCL